MKKVNVMGKDSEKIKEIIIKLKEAGFTYVEKNPELVICFGGDGMFLIAERVFPGVEKVLMKDSLVGNKSHDMTIEEFISHYKKGQFKVEEIRKIKATSKGRFESRCLVGVNDIVIRNSLPTEAIRFKLTIGKKHFEELLGDGVVISTPYGSEGYFKSITRDSFSKGIGVAFNNITRETKPRIVSEKEKIEIEITRGPAVLVADNNRDFVNLETGDKIIVSSTSEFARRLVL
jgi:NAD+ kinase